MICGCTTVVQSHSKTYLFNSEAQTFLYRILPFNLNSAPRSVLLGSLDKSNKHCGEKSWTCLSPHPNSLCLFPCTDVLCPNMKVQAERFKPNSTSAGLQEVPGDSFHAHSKHILWWKEYFNGNIRHEHGPRCTIFPSSSTTLHRWCVFFLALVLLCCLFHLNSSCIKECSSGEGYSFISRTR